MKKYIGVASDKEGNLYAKQDDDIDGLLLGLEETKKEVGPLRSMFLVAETDSGSLTVTSVHPPIVAEPATELPTVAGADIASGEMVGMDAEGRVVPMRQRPHA